MADQQRMHGGTDRLLWSVVEGWQGEILAVLPETEVEYWLARMPVLACRTWGQLRATVSTEVLEDVLERAGYGTFEEYTVHLAITGEVPLVGVEQVAADSYAELEDELPGDDDPFSAFHDLPACADGDWPPAPEYLMDMFLPDPILECFAEFTHTVFNGRQAWIPAARTPEALAALASLGFELREDARIAELFLT